MSLLAKERELVHCETSVVFLRKANRIYPGTRKHYSVIKVYLFYHNETKVETEEKSLKEYDCPHFRELVSTPSHLKIQRLR